MKSKIGNLKKYISTLSKYEVYFFYLLVLVNLLPVLITKFFPTVDGPAHLYNARLIIDLLSNDSSPLADYFVFNSNLNPNWSDHFILGGLLYIFPAFLAEKILLVSYLIFFPISFRFLFKTLKINEIYLLYFIFPFTYSFMFYYGFYNFHIGLVFFFLALGYWVKSLDLGFSYRRLFLLLVLSLCVFFSHLFVLAMLLMVIAILNLKDFVGLFTSDTQNKNLVFKSILLQFAVVLPAIILSVFYFFFNPISESSFDYIKPFDLWQMVVQAQPAKGVSYGKEAIFTKWIFILLSLISAFLLATRLRSFKRPLKNITIIWGLISIIVLTGLFILPDGTSTFGFVSSRLVLFFFLFFVVFLATQKVHLSIKVISFFFINYVNFALIKVYVTSSIEVESVTENIITASENIVPYSTVLPVNDSDNWIFGNISNYLGVDKPMVITENYEAAQNYFPLKWKPGNTLEVYTGINSGVVDVSHLIKNSRHEQVDYIFILTDGRDAAVGEKENSIKPLLDSSYALIYLSDDNCVKLFKKVGPKE